MQNTVQQVIYYQFYLFIAVPGLRLFQARVMIFSGRQEFLFQGWETHGQSCNNSCHQTTQQESANRFCCPTIQKNVYDQKTNAQYLSQTIVMLIYISAIFCLIYYYYKNLHQLYKIMNAQNASQFKKNIQQTQKQDKDKVYSKLISKENTFYNLLYPIMQSLPIIFDINLEPEPKVPQTAYDLKIYISQSEDLKLNNFIYTFTFPITAAEYLYMSEDVELQRKIDANLDKYQVIKQIDQFTKTIYLSYKKVLLISARDFVYVRYTFTYQNQYWIVITSIPGEDQFPGIKRGTIIKGATKIVEKQGKIDVSVYSQIDMKLALKPEATKAKGVLEIKKYLQKWYQYIQPSNKKQGEEKQLQ